MLIKVKKTLLNKTIEEKEMKQKEKKPLWEFLKGQIRQELACKTGMGQIGWVKKKKAAFRKLARAIIIVSKVGLDYLGMLGRRDCKTAQILMRLVLCSMKS